MNTRKSAHGSALFQPHFTLFNLWRHVFCIKKLTSIYKEES